MVPLIRCSLKNTSYARKCPIFKSCAVLLFALFFVMNFIPGSLSGVNTASACARRTALSGSRNNEQKAGQLYDKGISCLKKHRYEDAQRYFENVVELAPHIDDYWLALGDTYGILCRYDKAISSYSECLKIQEQEHNSTEKIAMVYNRMANMLYDLGDYQQSKTYMEKAITITEMLYPDSYVVLGRYYNNMGYLFYEMNDYTQALYYFGKTVYITRQFASRPNSNTAMALNGFGMVNKELGDYTRAAGYHEQALEIDRQIYSKPYPAMSFTYSNLGSLYMAMGDYPRSLEYYRQALAIDEQVFTFPHPMLAIRYNELGLAYNASGEHDRAIEHYKKAIDTDEQIKRTPDEHTAVYWDNLGAAYCYLEEYARARESYEKALDILLTVFPSGKHADVAATYTILAELHQKLGDTGKAEDCSRKAEASRQE
ncbi:MAG: tetratricopeptide repeat protein [Candidatus Auribacter fodinae]|uniref:Tetratricopeptide repeat protein n=1 Tax=Candidatus Auribacter fodinae TaxID=2093366 RepID=A0A3A4QYZ3_9BACT|nr:MAG: tetratricopeptide repeat protein [Candidatus Auribacter fodinae]